MFDEGIVIRAIRANSPDYLAITGLDKLQKLLRYPTIHSHYGVSSAGEYVEQLKRKFNIPILIQSYGPTVDEVNDNRGRGMKDEKLNGNTKRGALYELLFKYF